MSILGGIVTPFLGHRFYKKSGSTLLKIGSYEPKIMAQNQGGSYPSSYNVNAYVTLVLIYFNYPCTEKPQITYKHPKTCTNKILILYNRHSNQIHSFFNLQHNNIYHYTLLLSIIY